MGTAHLEDGGTLDGEHAQRVSHLGAAGVEVRAQRLDVVNDLLQGRCDVLHVGALHSGAVQPRHERRMLRRRDLQQERQHGRELRTAGHTGQRDVELPEGPAKRGLRWREI